MKVLNIINSLHAGGAEKLLVDTSIVYKKRGVDVDVLLLDGTKTPFYEHLTQDKNIKVISLGNTKNIYRPSNIFKIRKYLKSYDIIHVHLFPALYWVSLANFLNIKKSTIIVTEHNSTNRRRSIYFFKLLDKIIYKQFKKIITISNAVEENLSSHLGNSFNNLKKIYNGINLKVIEDALPYTKAELGYQESDKLILQVSSFTPQKDQETLIKAVNELSPSFKLLLVGEGPLKEKNTALVKELNLESKVQFLGVRSDVPRLLKSVDVIVLSSNYEGLSLSSVEGMASGKPFISTDAPGLTEVVIDAGILFKIGDEKQLSLIIKKLFEDKQYYLSVSKSCLQRSKKFDINLMVNNYLNLYENLLKDI